MKPKIYFMRKILPEEEELVKDLAYYKMFIGDNITRKIVANETKDVDAISTKFQANINLFLDEEVLKNAEKLKVINCCTSTFNIQTYINHGLDVKAATDLGIYVTNTPIIADSIADKTFALLLSAARRIVEADRFTREGIWKEQNVYHPRFIAFQVHHKTLGIIGLGKIGKVVAKRAKGFDMNIIYYDVERKKELEKELDIKYVDFDTLLKTSDFVSIHTGPVHHLIGERELSLMKKNAVLINTARGVCIDTSALYNALKNNTIGGAGLDVFEKEPIEPDNPILTLPNVTLTPHSSSEIESFTKTFKMGIQNITNLVNGKPPISLVNKEVVNIRPLN